MSSLNKQGTALYMYLTLYTTIKYIVVARQNHGNGPPTVLLTMGRRNGAEEATQELGRKSALARSKPAAGQALAQSKPAAGQGASQAACS